MMVKIMTKKPSKKPNKDEYEFITIEVSKYHVSVNAGRNYELINLDRCDTDTKVYSYETRLEIEGCCLYPDKFKGAAFRVSVNGIDSDDYRLSLKLKDCQAIDDKWNKIYKKVKGQQVPVYDLPKGIGFVEKNRGTTQWSGYAFVSPRTITDMLTLLPHVKPLFLEIHALKQDRIYVMRGLSLQTNNPAEE